MDKLLKIGISSLFFSKHVDANSLDTIDNDFAILDSSAIISLFDGPGKLDVAAVGLCQQGQGCIRIGLRDFELNPGHLFLLLPNQIVENKGIRSDFKGVFWVISRQVLEKLPKMNNILSFFFFLKDHPLLELTDEQRETFEDYHHLIGKVVKNRENIYRREAVLGLLQSLFYELCHIVHLQIPSETMVLSVKSRKEEIFELFFRLLNTSYQSERSVKFYADKLCLTPKYLSGVVKEVSHKTVSDWINQFVLLEAKALLKSSTMNVQEISDRLNFANQSFFGKYFKHYTGVSPKEFRKNRDA